MSQLSRPSVEALKQMSHDDLVALVLVLFDHLDKLTARVTELENQLNKNSHNSSKPPSSDGLKRQPAHPRHVGGKPSGGQKGHKGHALSWHEQPDRVEILQAEGICPCGCLVLADQLGVIDECRQQIDIPEPRLVVTEYRQLVTMCSCGRIHKGVFPESLPSYVSYGPRLKAYMVGLVQGHFISLSRSVEIIADQYGIKPSEGSVQKWVTQAADALDKTYVGIQQTILQEPVAHFDESGVRVNGQTNWLHVAATENQAYYAVHTHRGKVAMEAIGILPDFKGIAVHDHWKPYFNYSHLAHSLCNAHILRELRYFEETTEGHQWPIQLRHVLVHIKEAVADAKAHDQQEVPATDRAELLQRYDDWVQLGLWVFPEQPKDGTQKGKAKQHPATNLLLRMRDYKTEILRFLTNFRVPFDNNLAERLVRPIKVKLKVAGGFRAVGGAEAFCVIRSVWATDKLNGRNPFDSLRQAFG